MIVRDAILAEEPYTVAAASKAVLAVGGATLRPTADGLPFPLMGGELGRHADEVHFYPGLLNAIFLSIELSKKFGTPGVRHQAEAVEHNKLAHAGFAVAAGMALIAPFVWTSVKSGFGKALDAGTRAAALGLEKAGFSERADTMRRELTQVFTGLATDDIFIYTMDKTPVSNGVYTVFVRNSTAGVVAEFKQER